MTEAVRTSGTYHYEGPEALGSVLSHVCGAVGLYTQPVDAEFTLSAKEVDGQYQLALAQCTADGKQALGAWEAPATTAGRTTLGEAVLTLLREVRGITPSPWGSLVGVRPTKLYHMLWDRGLSEAERADYLREEKGLRADKIELLARIASVQRPILDRGEGQVSLYGGIPFCPSHCSYCSFPFALIHQYDKVSAFVDAFVKDCDAVRTLLTETGISVASVYMGGGTPTSLSDEDFAIAVRALGALRTDGIEFTVEAGRPDTVSAYKLAMMQEAGATRISINPQTMQDRILRQLGRSHSAQAIQDLYERVRQETALAVNMDFILGLPTQTWEDIVENMDYVCQSSPENVTIHTLALKRGSPMYAQKDQLALPTASVVAEMIAYCAERLTAAGYEPYYLYRQQYMGGAFENVGYAKPGTVCTYNVHMMEERQSILSMGPGSTTKCMRAPAYRQQKHYMPKDVDTYIQDQERLREKRARLWHSFYREEREHGNS